MSDNTWIAVYALAGLVFWILGTNVHPDYSPALRFFLRLISGMLLLAAVFLAVINYIPYFQ